MAKYAKLGDKANSFSDPTSGLNLKNKDVVELTPSNLSSKRVKKALNGGHLEYAEKSDYTEFQASKSDKKTKEVDDIEDTVVDYSEMDVKDIKKALKNNDLLKQNIIEMTADEDEPFTEEDLADLTKDELLDIITNGYEGTEEEE